MNMKTSRLTHSKLQVNRWFDCSSSTPRYHILQENGTDILKQDGLSLLNSAFDGTDQKTKLSYQPSITCSRWIRKWFSKTLNAIYTMKKNRNQTVFFLNFGFVCKKQTKVTRINVHECLHFEDIYLQKWSSSYA